MVRPVRKRFWVECAATFLSGSLVAVTTIWPTWIELLFGVDPDGGSGALEWTFVACLVTATAAFSFLARREWRHDHVQPVIE